MTSDTRIGILGPLDEDERTLLRRLAVFAGRWFAGILDLGAEPAVTPRCHAATPLASR